MAYGTIKVDNIVFTNAGSDQTITVSGLVASTSGNLTVTGTISGNTIQGQTVSGVTVTGTTANFTSGNFTTITGGTVTLTSGVIASGTAANPSLSILGDANTGLYSPGADQLAISTSGAQRLVVDANGCVGVGAAPDAQAYRLQIYNPSQDVAAISLGNNVSGSGASNGLIIIQNQADTQIINRENGYFSVATNNTERLRVTAAGSVGIGVSSPSGLLTLGWNSSTGINAGLIGQVNNTAGANNGYRIGLRTSSDATNWCSIDQAFTDLGTNASTYMAFTTTNGYTPAERMRLTSTGLGIGTTSPSSVLDVVSAATGVAEFNGPANATVSFTATSFAEGKIQCGGEFTIGSTNNFPTAFITNGTERARIDSSGRLLVGTSSDFDGYLNQVSSSSGTLLSLRRTNSNPGSIKLSSGASGDNVGNNGQLGYLRWYGFHTSTDYEAARISAEVDGVAGANDMPGRLVFSTTADGASSPTERMRIDNIGRIGINTSPASFARLHVASDSDSYYPLVVDDVKTGTASATAVYFRRNTALVGTISTTNTATAYNTSSDYRLKENVAAVTDGITRLQQLKPSRFNFIADPDKTVDGFIAHEVQDVVPEAITGEKDAVDDEGNPQYQGIDQSKLVPLLTAALQEAVAKIESLEARLTAAGI